MLSHIHAMETVGKGVAESVGQASRLSPISRPGRTSKRALPALNIPGAGPRSHNVRDRRDACPTARIRFGRAKNDVSEPAN